MADTVSWSTRVWRRKKNESWSENNYGKGSLEEKGFKQLGQDGSESAVTASVGLRV